MMRQQSFYDWLLRELATTRRALISLYENRDRLLYIEAPEIRKKYMSIFGSVENTVLQSELEVTLLKKKVELIQIAINRREKIDLEKIDEQIKAEREQMLSRLEKDDVTLNELPQLSEEDLNTLKKLYHDITTCFHPAVNTFLTETEKDLYEKALQAFKMQDVDAMKIIHDCLFDENEKYLSGAAGAVDTDEDKDEREDYRSIASALTTDYSLAAELYPFFAPLEEDIVVRNSVRDCDVKRKEVEAEIVKIRSGFPFNACETMNDKTKTDDYLAELKVRSRRSESEKKELLEKISKLTEGYANG